MIKTILTAIALAAAVPAFGADIVGKWQMQQDVNGFKLTMTMAIEQNVTHLSNDCEWQGKRAHVSVDVPSKIEGNTYSVLGTATKTTSENGLSCDVSAQPMTLTYQATDTQLTLSANGQSMVLTRVQ